LLLPTGQHQTAQDIAKRSLQTVVLLNGQTDLELFSTHRKLNVKPFVPPSLLELLVLLVETLLVAEPTTLV